MMQKQLKSFTYVFAILLSLTVVAPGEASMRDLFKLGKAAKRASKVPEIIDPTRHPHKPVIKNEPELNSNLSLPDKALRAQHANTIPYDIYLKKVLGLHNTQVFKPYITSPIVYRTLPPAERMHNFIIVEDDKSPAILTITGAPTKAKGAYYYPYFKAKLKHASFLAHFLREDRYYRYVTPNLRQGVIMANNLLRILHRKPYNEGHVQFLLKEIVEDALLLLAHIRFKYASQPVTEPVNQQDLELDEIDFFNEIFQKRCMLLSQQLTSIAALNKVPEEDILTAIEQRKDTYKHACVDEYLLILTRNLNEFLPKEAHVVRTFKKIAGQSIAN